MVLLHHQFMLGNLHIVLHRREVDTPCAIHIIERYTDLYAGLRQALALFSVPPKRPSTVP